MRSYDKDEAKELNAEPWMLNLLRCNPEHTSWGPHEDYMAGDGRGWDRPVFVPSWKEFEWDLNDLNECANFYFDVVRESKQCDACQGSGYAPEARKVAQRFYEHSSDTGVGWRCDISQDELEALQAHGRCKGGTVEQVNETNKRHGLLHDFHHDAINRGILIEARCQRLGLELLCPCCKGDGYIYTEEKAHVQLVLWMLHPRKGCSRGVEIQRVEQSDLPAIRKWLKTAARRNTRRFSRL